jgi:hypothetical protein
MNEIDYHVVARTGKRHDAQITARRQATNIHEWRVENVSRWRFARSCRIAADPPRARSQVGGTKKPLSDSLSFHPLLVLTYRSW